MPFLLSALNEAANRRRFTKTAASLSRAREEGRRTAFLSHSALDTHYANGIQVLLEEAGWNVYIFSQDQHLEQTPSKESAQRVQSFIRTSTLFLFLATPNSMNSRWCPWEIGYADGVKPWESIFIIPTRDNNYKFHGSEYLQIYKKIDLSADGVIRAYVPTSAAGTNITSV